MTENQSGMVLRHVRTLFDVGATGGLTDGQLLERFASRDREVAELAFAALVDRHGPMVLRICRSVLRNPHDAEDAFQATFLVLVRQAGSIRSRDSAACWLHGVARRVASCARSAAARRRVCERRAAETARRSTEPMGCDDLGEVLSQEIGRLSEPYRAAIVLCDLQGLTEGQAARRLGWPIGTVRSRLARGRERLRNRLTRHGLAPGIAGPGLLVAARPATVPPALVAETGKAAMRVAEGEAVAGVVSASVAALTAGGLRIIMLTRLKMTGAAMVVAALTGAGALAYQAAGRNDTLSPPNYELDREVLPSPGSTRDNAPPMKSVLGLAFSPDGRSLASVGETSANNWGVPGTLRVWDVDSRRERFVVQAPGLLWDVAFSPDGKSLATGSADNTARLWDAATGRERVVLKGHTSWVNHVAFSPDGKTLATGSGDSTIKLWDVETGTLRETIEPKGGEIYTIDYSPDGKRLVLGGDDRHLCVWDIAGKRAAWKIPAHLHDIEAVAFSPDGKLVATASRDKMIKLWDAATGQKLASLPGHSVQALRLAFSSDGAILASASGRWGDYDFTPGPGETKLWDVATRSEMATLRGHSDRTFAIAFAPDGVHLATGSWDKTIKIWDVRTRRELGTLPPVITGE